MKMPFKVDLKDKVAVVTGGGGILCSGFCEALAACGAKVAVCDIGVEAAEAVAAKIRDAGGTAAAFKMNVLDKESIIAARNDITAQLGECDILINGAGGNNPKGSTTMDQLTPDLLKAYTDGTLDGVKTFFDLEPDGIEFVFNLNFLGTLLPTQVFALDMAKKQGSNIINISSMNSFKPLTRIPAYSGAKAAVSNLTQWLAVHFAPVAIRVNAIAPGFFLTNQNRSLLMNPDGSRTARSEKILTHTPMNRFGEIDDLTGTLLWLADDKSSGFVNGIIVPVDGGFSAYSGV